MSGTTQNTSGFKAFVATAAAIAAYTRVKLDSNGEISAADADEPWIGITQEAIAADGVGTVRLRNAPGSYFVTASAAVAAGARLYATDAGRVDDAPGTGAFTGLQAAQAATDAGDVIEAVPCDQLTFTANADQAVATDAGSTQDLANALRTALINAGIIKGAA